MFTVELQPESGWRGRLEFPLVDVESRESPNMIAYSKLLSQKRDFFNLENKVNSFCAYEIGLIFEELLPVMMTIRT